MRRASVCVRAGSERAVQRAKWTRRVEEMNSYGTSQVLLFSVSMVFDLTPRSKSIYREGRFSSVHDLSPHSRCAQPFAAQTRTGIACWAESYESCSPGPDCILDWFARREGTRRPSAAASACRPRRRRTCTCLARPLPAPPSCSPSPAAIELLQARHAATPLGQAPPGKQIKRNFVPRRIRDK